MPRRNAAQLNIRSDFVRARVDEIAEATGMTATEIVEDALRGYVPPAEAAVPCGMIRKGPILVIASDGRPKVTLEEANAALEASRDRIL